MSSSPASYFLNDPRFQEMLGALVKLAKTQGHISYDDLNEGLLNDLVDPTDVETAMARLQELGVEIREESADVGNEDAPTTVGEADSLSDPERMYFRQLGKIPLLTREREVEIFKRIESATGGIACEPFDYDEAHAGLRQVIDDGRRAKAEMITANLRLVVFIAKRHTNRGLPMLDLIQEGNIGLMKAVDRFDYRLGYKFSTYATWWIRQSITRAIADQSRTIRIPMHMIERIQKLSRVRRQLLQEIGREPTPEEIAGEIHVPVERIRAVMDMALHPVSLNAPVGDSTAATFGDFLEDHSAGGPVDEAGFSILKSKIRQILAALTDREREVLELRFGIMDNQPRTLEEVGRQFNVTRERIRQIEAKALKKIRHPSRIRELAGFTDAA